MINPLIYVYGLVQCPFSPSPVLEAFPLLTLLFGNLYAVVKQVSEEDFSEENFKRNLSDISWLESQAREHINVISQIMEHATVIPFKFGTLFKSSASLGKFIVDYSDSLDLNFRYIEGKEEWAVKIYCDRKSLSGYIDELSEDASSLEKQIMASSPGKAFLLRRKKIELVESEMDRLNKLKGQEFYDAFRNLSEVTCLNNLLPKEFTGRTDTMILNASFLVKKENVPDFTAVVENLGPSCAGNCFKVETTGPWPPFSFISMNEIT